MVGSERYFFMIIIRMGNESDIATVIQSVAANIKQDNSIVLENNGSEPNKAMRNIATARNYRIQEVVTHGTRRKIGRKAKQTKRRNVRSEKQF